MGKAKFELQADAKSAIEGFLKLSRAEQKAFVQLTNLKQKMTGFEKTTEKAGKTAQRAMFGTVKGLLQAVGAAALLKKGMDAVIATFDKREAQRKKAAAQAETGEALRGQIIQLAGGDIAKLKEIRGEVRRSRLEEGLTKEQARSLQVTLESQGRGAQRGQLVEAAQFFGLENLSELASEVATFQDVMGKSTGTFKQFQNQLVEGGQASKVLTVAFAKNISIVGQFAKQVGLSSSATVAGFATLTQITKSPEVAATQFKSLLTKAAKFDIKATTVESLITQLQTKFKGKTGGEIQAELGERGFPAFTGLVSKLKETAELQKRIERAKTETGTARDATRRGIILAREDPELAALRNKRIAQQEEEIALEAQGLKALKSDTADAKLIVSQETRDIGIIQRTKEDIVSSIARRFGASAETATVLALRAGAGAEGDIGREAQLLATSPLGFLLKKVVGTPFTGGEEEAKIRTEASLILNERNIPIDETTNIKIITENKKAGLEQQTNIGNE